MGSPLAPILADIFMIELQGSLIPNLKKIKFWRTIIRNANGYPNWIINQVCEQINVKQRDPVASGK